MALDFDYVDFVVRYVPSYGYLPILFINGKEVMRGEFKKTAELALKTNEANFNKLKEALD